MRTVFPPPPGGWRCFHCDEVLRTYGAAKLHFGADPLKEPACRIKSGDEMGLLMALRKAEEQLERYRTEDSDKDRQIYAMQADHQTALRRAEEQGYARAIEDMKKEGWHEPTT